MNFKDERKRFTEKYKSDNVTFVSRDQKLIDRFFTYKFENVQDALEGIIFYSNRTSRSKINKKESTQERVQLLAKEATNNAIHFFRFTQYNDHLDIQKECSNIINGIKSYKNIDMNFLQRKIEEMIEKNIQENNEQIIVTYNKVVDDEKIENTLDYTRKLENDTVNVDFKLNRKIKEFNIEVNLNNVIKIVNNLDKIELDETNNVLLEDLDEDNKNNILNILNENRNSQQNRINEKITQETFDNILINLELKQAGAEEIGNDGTISETERNRFNSNFEFYEGEEVSKENVLKLIEVAKNNLDDIKVTKYKEDEYLDEEKTQPAVQEYSMLIKRSSKNDEVANKFYNTIKDSDKDSYNIKIEYNQQTGLVESILISVND